MSNTPLEKFKMNFLLLKDDLFSRYTHSSHAIHTQKTQIAFTHSNLKIFRISKRHDENIIWISSDAFKIMSNLIIITETRNSLVFFSIFSWGHLCTKHIFCKLFDVQNVKIAFVIFWTCTSYNCGNEM